MIRILLFSSILLFATGLSAQIWFEQYPTFEGSTITALESNTSEITSELSASGLRNTSISIDEATGLLISGVAPSVASCQFSTGVLNILESNDFALAVNQSSAGISLTRFDFEVSTCRIRDISYTVNLPLAPALDTVVTSLMVGEGFNVYVAGYLVYDTNRSYGFFVSRINRFTGEILSTYLEAPRTAPFNFARPNLLTGLSNGDVLINVASTGFGGGATVDFVQRITAAGEPGLSIGYGQGLSTLLQVLERSSGEIALLVSTNTGFGSVYDLTLTNGPAFRRLRYSGQQTSGSITLLDFAPSTMIESTNGDLILAGLTSSLPAAGGISGGVALVTTAGVNPIDELIYTEDLLPNRGPNGLLALSNGDFVVSFGTFTPSLARIAGTVSPPSNFVDLELDIIAQSANQFTVYSNDLLLSNTGTQTAHDIVVAFPKPAGTVYQGGNEFTASQGTFSPYGNQEWTIDSLEAGQTIVLSAKLFLLTPLPGVSYAQVLAQAEPDADSTPGNGTPPTVNEDDEASTGSVSPPSGGTGSDIDIELAMATASTSIGIFNVFSVELVVSNTSANNASGVEVFVPISNGVVYTGGNEFSATLGGYNPYGDQIWTVGDLPAGASETLTVNYFLLSDDPIDFYAQVFSATETDVDSNPRNGTCCTPVEDDETVLTINANMTQPLTLSAQQLRDLRPVTLTSVYPNVLADLDVIVEVIAVEDGQWPLIAYDMLGRAREIAQLSVVRGINEISVNVSNLPSGNYRLTIPVQGLRVISEQLIINR